jgi:hypothetical protein
MLSLLWSANQAPTIIREPYGTNSGFDYAEDEVVGGSVVGIPIRNADGLIMKRSLTALVAWSLPFSMMFARISQRVKRLIWQLVIHITRVTRDISGGHLEREIAVQSMMKLGNWQTPLS